MPQFELLIIGGGPAGLAAARAFRDARGAGRVAIVTDEQRMPYSRPPLTKELLRGETDEDSLPLEDEQWLTEHAVSLVSGRAVSLDPMRREVALSGSRTLSYESCVIATGAEPTRLPIPGADDPSVRVIRTLDHVRELLRRLEPGTEVVVIGAGFIGCEIASSLRHRGLPVRLLAQDALPNVARLGEPAAGEIARWLEADGVALTLGVQVDAIQRDGERLRVRTGETTVAGTLVVMATGVAPRGELLNAAGMPLAAEGAVPVDASMRTALPGIFAAGDVCCAFNAAAGRPLRVEHWGDALAQGEIAGRAAAGQDAQWRHVPGFWSTIGGRTLKYAAWGDGFDDSDFEARPNGGFVARYGRGGKLVGVLAHDADADYEHGKQQIEEGAAWPLTQSS